MHRRLWLAVAVTLSSYSGLAQSGASKPSAPALSPSVRLMVAKSAYLKFAGGSETPFDVISEDVKNWGRYVLVDSPEKADLILEVTAPNSASGISVSSTMQNSQSGIPAESVTSTRDLEVTRITLIVYDARSKMALWSASEQPKHAMREKSRQDNVVAASEHLVAKLRERVEPENK